MKQYNKPNYVPPAKTHKMDKCIFGDMFLLPENTAGCDDYHEYTMRPIHNLQLVFECEIQNLIASVAVYKKIDPTQPAYFKMKYHQTSGGTKTIVWD